MKNRDFFYQQYDRLNWKNQEKTKINSLINSYIIENVIFKKRGGDLSLFDIGFGIGFFFEMLYEKAVKKYSFLYLAGCEPSKSNYDYFVDNKLETIKKSARVEVENKTFLDSSSGEKRFDFLSAIYVFPHFLFEELPEVLEKIYSMLKDGGKFILVVADQQYLEEKISSEKDLFIEKTVEEFNGKEYTQVLHHSEIPEIGTVIDYNREESFYLDLFKEHGFKLIMKENVDDSGFVSTLFVFEK